MSKTTNYRWEKPTVGGDADVWGDHLNTTLDDIDTTVKAVSDDIATQIAASARPPTGGVTMFGGTVAPDGWFECDGRAVSRTTYADLFTAIGVLWGTGDGSTTFNIPDMRGYFPRGYDHGRGIDSGRALASVQADQNAAHTHTFVFSNDNSSGGANSPGHGSNTNNTWTTASSGGTEARPKNIAVMFIIKT